MRTIKIIRLDDDGKQTLSFAWVFDKVTKLFEFRVLELPWKRNQQNVSCIPKDIYTVVKFNSPTHGNVFLYQDVPNREYIEMHPGNYNSQIRGCQLPGEAFSDINSDGLLDVTSSRKTLEIIWDLMPEEFRIEIL